MLLYYVWLASVGEGKCPLPESLPSSNAKHPGEVSEWLKEHAWKVCIG